MKHEIFDSKVEWIYRTTYETAHKSAESRGFIWRSSEPCIPFGNNMNKPLDWFVKGGEING
ncbi:hypothetical protein COL32_10430 [Bacillus pseudomycoides]|nr:hypothetical protein COL29_20755 [Bacillus pseudomycoides]PFX45408.1 hypothetical protein COL32_10430 [Bacillus pseudomycoides]